MMTAIVAVPEGSKDDPMFEINMKLWTANVLLKGGQPLRAADLLLEAALMVEAAAVDGMVVVEEVAS